MLCSLEKGVVHPLRGEQGHITVTCSGNGLVGSWVTVCNLLRERAGRKLDYSLPKPCFPLRLTSLPTGSLRGSPLKT